MKVLNELWSKNNNQEVVIVFFFNLTLNLTQFNKFWEMLSSFTLIKADVIFMSKQYEKTYTFI